MRELYLTLLWLYGGGLAQWVRFIVTDWFYCTLMYEINKPKYVAYFSFEVEFA